MLKTLGLIATGLVAGAIVAIIGIGQPDPAAPSHDASVRINPNSGSEESLAALRADVEQRLATIDQRLVELAAEFDALRAAKLPAFGHSTPSMSTPEELARLREETRRRFADSRATALARSEQHTTERLLAAGFTPERIDWIRRRDEELKMEGMRAQYEAQRSGRPLAPNELTMILTPEIALHAEMGDREYERYLTALGRPTAVGVSRACKFTSGASGTAGR